jgi:quinolinate synthase
MLDLGNENRKLETPSAVAEAVAATADLYERVKGVIPPGEWALFAPDIVAIRRLKRERNAIVLAHNYMTPEIFHGVADVVGDSLVLAREAAKSAADVIVVAGVHFMAESAKLLNPERTVLCPDPAAGCSLAEAITPDDVRALRARHPGVPIVAYVNTSAAVKAEVDICCTSANARAIVESLREPEVIMVPDEYLALNVARETQVTIHSYPGHCEVHARFRAEDIRAFRDEHPGLAVLIHPECAPDVVAEADFAGSTGAMNDWIERHRPPTAMLVTECSMSDNIAVQHPEIAFIRPCQMCAHMKRVTLAKIRASLETLTHEIVIDPAIAAPARRAVERMIAVRV